MLRGSVVGQKESPLLKSDSSGVEELLCIEERLMTFSGVRNNQLPEWWWFQLRTPLASCLGEPLFVRLDYASWTDQGAGLPFGESVALASSCAAFSWKEKWLWLNIATHPFFRLRPKKRSFQTRDNVSSNRFIR